MCLKIFDLIVQTVAHVQLLENGMPKTLVYSYAGLVATNAFVFSIGVLMPQYHSSFVEVLIDSVYEICFLAVSIELLTFLLALTYS